MDPQDPQLELRRRTERARIEGASVWLELLDDLNLWNRQPDQAQDQCIEQVLQGLGPAWRGIGTKIYESPEGSRQRIAHLRYLGPDPQKPWPQFHPLDGVFALIPGGVAVLGSASAEKGRDHNEYEPTSIQLKPLLMALIPVTKGLWMDVLELSPDLNSPQKPMTEIPWWEAQFWASQAGPGFQLPGEAQWEYCCRAGSGSRYHFGDEADTIEDYAWLDSNSGRQLQTPALKRPNAFGLYDMIGNVWEWCLDPFRYSQLNPDPASAPGDRNIAHVIRGSCVVGRPKDARSAARGQQFSAAVFTGLRLARSVADRATGPRVIA